MRRVRRFVTETLLWLAAAAGLLCVAMVILAYTMSISLVLFRTGSMEPAIPSGSVAVVQEISAAEVQIGDVLTVDRPGQLPVTHRVTSIEEGEAPQQRVVTMQGDANDTEDPHPYTITEAQVTLFSVPHLAQPIHQMSNPYVLGTVTLLASALVGWAFWPRASPPQQSGPPARRTRRKPRGSAALGVGILGLCAGGALLIGPASAPAAAQTDEGAADATSTVIRGEYLTLTSVLSEEDIVDLTPGDRAYWDIGVQIKEIPEDATLRAGIEATGSVPLIITVHSCRSQWETTPAQAATSSGRSSNQEDSCPAEYQLLLQDYKPLEARTDSLRAGNATGVHDLAYLPITSGERPLWFRLEVTVPESLRNDMQAAGTLLRVHISAAGEDFMVSPIGGEESGTEPLPGTEDPEVSEESAVAGAEQGAPSGFPVTGFSLLAVLIAAILSILTGMVLRKKSRSTVTRPAPGVVRLTHQPEGHA